MKTAKQLKDKYETDMKQLQENCKHPKIRDWLTWCDFHGNPINEVKQCEICWTILNRKINCFVCKKDFIIEEKDYRSWDQLCPECQKKGKYYCWAHKKFYDDPQGCSKCLEFLKKVEEMEKEVRKSEGNS